MQTLGLSDTPVKTEGRLKSLLWPSVRTSNDVDYLGAQGYWVCSIVAVLSLVTLIITGHPVAGASVLLFFYVGGVGVRQCSVYAAAAVFTFYMIDSVLSHSGGVLRIIIAALLLANLRATWIASRWQPGSDPATPPPRFNETWGDKFADQFPLWLWPKLRIAYYVFSAGFLLLVAIGMAILYYRHA
jgi:hypothetical protein